MNCITIADRLTKPIAIPASIAQEVRAFPELSEPVLDAILTFETKLLSERNAPLPSDTEEDNRLRRNRDIRRMCRLVFRTMNEAVILEADLRLKRCDLFVRNRSRKYNNPSQWGQLADLELPEAVPADRVRSWSSIFEFFKSSLGHSFHIVFVSVTDEMLRDEKHWAIEFLEWCFKDCNLYLPEGTNLVFVPWIRTLDSSRYSVMASLRQFCVCSVSESESSGATRNIAIGNIVRLIVKHRSLLAKAMIADCAETAGKERSPDFAETVYLLHLRKVLFIGLLNDTGNDNQHDTDMEFFEELRVLANNIQDDIYRTFSIVMHDPFRWTADSICLEADQSMIGIYMKTLFYVRGADFAIGSRVAAVRTENDDSPLIADMHLKCIGSLKILVELMQNIKSDNAIVHVTRNTAPTTLLLPLICSYRCITFRAQNPPDELKHKLLQATELLPNLIQILMRDNKNDCGVIEILIFECLHCVLLHLKIIRNRTNQSPETEFTWKMHKLLANAIEATALAVFDKLKSNYFKGEFVLGIVKALNLSLKRAAELIEEPHPYAHCTEPFPEETIDRIRQCVMKLDVDLWYTRVNAWNLSVPIPILLPTVFDHSNLPSSSLHGLSKVLGQLEKHLKHQFLKKSITSHTEERRSFAWRSESFASSAQMAAVKNPLANLENGAHSADLSSAATSIYSELSEQNNMWETLSVDGDVIISIEENPTRAQPHATLHAPSTPRVQVVYIAEISSGESGESLSSTSNVNSAIGLDLSDPCSTDFSSTSTSKTHSN